MATLKKRSIRIPKCLKFPKSITGKCCCCCPSTIKDHWRNKRNSRRVSRHETVGGLGTGWRRYRVSGYVQVKRVDGKPTDTHKSGVVDNEIQNLLDTRIPIEFEMSQYPGMLENPYNISPKDKQWATIFEHANKNNLKVFNVEGIGDCLWNSVWAALKYQGKEQHQDALELKEDVLAHLSLPENYSRLTLLSQLTDGVDLDTYVKHLRARYILPDQWVLREMAVLLKTAITVYTDDDDRPVLTYGDEKGRKYELHSRVAIGNKNEDHFVAMIPRDTTPVEEPRKKSFVDSALDGKRQGSVYLLKYLNL